MPSQPAAGRRRTLGRRLLLGLAWLCAVPLALLLAWALSNRLFDADLRERPVELRPPEPRPLPGAAFHALLGIRAPAGQDAAAAGRRLWEAEVQRAAAQVTGAPAAPAPMAQAEGRDWLPMPTGAPWVCADDDLDCHAHWLEAAPALRMQRESLRVAGERCEALVAMPGLRYEEAWPPLMHPGMPIGTLTGLSTCMAWFRSGAALSFAAGDGAATLQQLQAGDRLWRAVAEGSHSLIQHMVVLRAGREQLRLLATLALRDAGLAREIAALLEAWPDEGRALRRWMVFEAAYQRAQLPRPEQACGEEVWPWACPLAWGYQPRRTEQAVDEAWLALLRQTQAAEPALAALAFLNQQAAPSPWNGLRWLNTVGQVLLPSPQLYADYVARHADLALHRRAVALAVAASLAGIAPAGRDAWSARQPMSEAQRQRLRWSPDGRSLSATAWQQDLQPPRAAAARDAIIVRWPDPSTPP